MRPDRWRLCARTLCYAAATLPFLFLVSLLVLYHVDVPFWDHWALVPLIDKTFRGEVSLHDLCAQHGDHRQFFSNGIILLLARWTHWNIHYEVAVNVLLALATFLTIARMVIKAKSSVGQAWTWLIPAISLIFFSIHRWENWLLGFHVGGLLSVLAAVVGIAVLSSPSLSWNRLCLAIGCGILSTFSFAAGLVFWPVGFFLLLLGSYTIRGQRTKMLLAWFVITLLVLCLYFRDYARPSINPSLLYGLEHPYQLIVYVLKNLGAMFAARIAPWAGLLGLLTFMTLACYVLGPSKSQRSDMLGCVALGLFSIGNALVIGFARVGFQPSQALSSRYIGLSCLFWISILILCAETIQALLHKPRNNPMRSGLVAHGIGFLCILMVGTIAYWDMRSVKELQSFSQLLRNGREELLEPKDEKVLERLYRHSEAIKKGTQVLKRWRLSLFREA